MLNNHICSNEACNNPVFKKLDKCALHCEKKDYQTDKMSGLLLEFNKLLIDYIASKVEKKKNQAISDINKILSDREKILEENSYLLFDTFSYFDFNGSFIEFYGILFPCRDGKDKPYEDFFCILNLFHNIGFDECSFYHHNTILEDISFYFKNCHFLTKKTYTICPMMGILDYSIFEHCNFDCNIEVIPRNSDDNKLIKEFKSPLFLECQFSKNLIIKDIIFENYLFSIFDISNEVIIKSLEIQNSIFIEKLKLNKLNCSNLVIEDCFFESKLEIKNSCISNFQFLNSNVSKVFDAFGSTFVQFKMEKTIFEDFSGFEKVKFGKENENFISEFTYVTFKSFSNFREAIFFSGLDLSRTNLKEQPNFFKVDIQGENTNRETYRIIKNSFDKNGNHIVANDYFIMEMKAYREEIKKEIDIKEKLIIIKSEFLKIKTLDKSNIKNFILIFKKNLSEIYNNNKIYKKIVIDLNDAISGFGDNYIRPIRILTLSIILYNLCFLMQKYYAFDESDSIIFCIIDFLNQSSKSFLIFSNFLKDRQGIEFISLLFYIWFSILIWQIVVAIKRHTIR